MKKTRLRSCLIAAGLATLTIASTPAMAGIVINATEVGGDVIFEGGGTLDLRSWRGGSSGDRSIASIKPDNFLIIGRVGRGTYELPTNFAGPTSIGPSHRLIEADLTTGNKLGLSWRSATLFARANYHTGDPLSGSATFLGYTFETLGVTEGTYTWTWDTPDGSDFYTINIGPVPAPGTPGVIALLGLAGMFGKRRRRIA